jgi:hypothetical protein
MRPLLVVLCLAGTLSLVFWAGADAGARSERALQAQRSEPWPEAASKLGAAISVPAVAARARAVAAVLDEAGPGDVEALWNAVQTSGSSIDPISLVLFADWWASFDPEAAYHRAIYWQFRDVDAAIFAIVRRWASQDPDAARAAVELISDDRRSGLALEALLLGWAERGPRQDTWDYLERMPVGILRQKGIQVLLSHMLATEGVDPTIEFVEALPDDALGRFKLQAFRRAGIALARHAPKRATHFAKQHSSSPHGDGVLRLVARTRVGLEGAPGIEWLLAAPPGRERDDAMSKAYRKWLNTDRKSAVAWLKEAKPDPALEPALVLLVGIESRGDPSAAQATLARIEDPGLRQDAQLRLARAWLALDRAAATEWLAQSGLPEELRSQLLEGRVQLPTIGRKLPL